MRTAVMQIAKKYIKDHPVPRMSLAEAEVHILKPIVSKIHIELFGPDAMLIEKFKEGENLFIIAKGECLVDFRRGNLNTQTTS